MTSNPCASFRENIPAYALGALDVDEAAALEAHLRICDSCPGELAGYCAVSDALLTSVPPQRPSAALRQRLQGRLPSLSGRQKARRVWPSWSFGQFALGAALVLLVALNIFSLLQTQVIQRQQAQFAQQIQTGQAAFSMLAYPDTKSLPITGSGIAGTLLLDKEHSAAVLIAWDLPPLPENQTYQIWLVDPKGERTSVGLFRPETGQRLTSKAIFMKRDISGFTGLGVTLEPAGGSKQPTSPRIFKVDF
ncbi:MAG: anti-sigma factor [Anaerolineales bacterium]